MCQWYDNYLKFNGWQKRQKPGPHRTYKLKEKKKHD